MTPDAGREVLALALQHHAAGRLPEAEGLYRRILAERPQDGNALHYLGVVAHQVGQSAAAADLISRAIALGAASAEAYSNLGSALNSSGRLVEAIAACRNAIAIARDFVDAYVNLGNALASNGELESAIDAYRRALDISPRRADAYNNLGNVLTKKGEIDSAIGAFRQAIAIDGRYADAHANLAVALTENGDVDEAILSGHRAIAIMPRSGEAHLALADALRANGQIDDAIAGYRRSLAIAPDNAVTHFHLGCTLLLRGDLEDGWREYEWRLKCKRLPRTEQFAKPRWDGSPLEDRALLLYADQGLGDTMQFIRYLPLVAARARRVIVECQPELQRLLRESCTQAEIVVQGEQTPEFDLQCPLAGLPFTFHTVLDSIPAEVPYLVPDPKLVTSWKQALATFAGGANVAIAWAGNPKFTGDGARSLTLDRLAPLTEARGVTIFSIQKGSAALQADHPPAGLKIIDLSPRLEDLSDTAAAISQMDLVITTDTGVAHLAGALGRPVWVMLQFVADWRWLSGRADSPWYPTMRLFRQRSRGDWGFVISQVVDALAALREK